MSTTPPVAHSAKSVAAAAQLACLLEVSAAKPGNVAPGRHFADVRYEDFLASAVAIGPVMAAAGERPLGATVRRAIEATTAWTRTNTNLGIVLLFVPLARAALASDPGRPLRDAVRHVLAITTVADAREVYVAIRLARPGGLGKAVEQDAADEPTVTLLEAMRLARDRDGIAREYATGFETTFALGVPALRRARRDGLSWDDAVVETYLTLLAAQPDTHVLRRAGVAQAEAIAQAARAVIEAGGVQSDAGRRAVAGLDASLRDERHSGNPGTTADLTAAALFVVLLEGGWQGTN